MMPMFFCMSVSVAQADTVRLKNGNYFDGRVIDDTGPSIKMQINVGTVEFKKDEIDEMTLADAEENAAIERLWGLSADVAEGTGEDLVDEYLHKGKVKYQGRWISEDVYDVIKKEQEIKEKRYRFIQEKQERERMKTEYQDGETEVTAQTPSVFQSEPLPFSKKYKKFGTSSVAGNATEVVASTHTQREEAPIASDTNAGLQKVKRLGEQTTKTIATTTDPYRKETV